MDDAWAPQPHYTDGEPVHFWDGRELILVRMNTSSLDDAASAASSLNARYFFKRVDYDTATMTYTWAAYDRNALRRRKGQVPVREPLKTFKTNDTAPLIMWAAAKGYS